MVLKFVGAQFVQQPDAPPFLLLVDQQTPALLSDRLESQFELPAAIAAKAVKDVAG